VTPRELGPGETARAHGALRALRPHLGDREAFVRHVDEVLRAQGYRLAAVLPAGGGDAEAAAGFRVLDMLAHGRILYVDDLSTLPAARGRGHGAALLEWCAAEGRRLGCRSLQLDSGVGPERADAHRLYLNAGMRIASHHFARDLG